MDTLEDPGLSRGLDQLAALNVTWPDHAVHAEEGLRARHDDRRRAITGVLLVVDQLVKVEGNLLDRAVVRQRDRPPLAELLGEAQAQKVDGVGLVA